MADQFFKRGLWPTGQTKGGAPLSVVQYGKPSSDTNVIYPFDLVQKTASSVPDPNGFGSNPAPGCRGANLGTAGTGLWLGVSLNYGAASANTMHTVIDDPFAVFLVQSDSATAQTVAALVGKNANINVSGAANAQLGNPLSKQSGMTLNSASIATTASKDVRILGFWNNTTSNPDNAAFPILEVEIVLHQYKGQSAGV